MMKSSPTDASTTFHCILRQKECCICTTQNSIEFWLPKFVLVALDHKISSCITAVSDSSVFYLTLLFWGKSYIGMFWPPSHMDTLGQSQKPSTPPKYLFSVLSSSTGYITNQHTTFKYVSTAALCNQTEYQTKAYINSKQSKD